eukprot:c6826_g1_i1.p1 GENE.c6826_g1_i1~~c6826_g1_i1.p1  ORF type:complete len:562 (+),score=89.42 c6826_g1_i1:1-1686(+)
MGRNHLEHSMSWWSWWAIATTWVASWAFSALSWHRFRASIKRGLDRRAIAAASGQDTKTPVVVIAGAGFSGICMGIRLQKLGIPYRIFEKSTGVGGTWLDNTYPGAACDVPTFLYSFSFELNPNWSRIWSPQKDILAYIERCAAKYGVRQNIQFSSSVTSATFDPSTGLWDILVTRQGDGRVHTERVRANFFVSALGQLNVPHTPAFTDHNLFKGPSFHSARWDHSVPLENKRIAVVGTGPSAIQIIPRVAEIASKLFVFHRAPTWFLYRLVDFQVPWIFRVCTPLQRLVRWIIFTTMDCFTIVLGGQRKKEDVGKSLWETQHSARVRKLFPNDEHMRQALTPDFPMFCKRVGISNDYLETFTRPNTQLVTDHIERFSPKGIVVAGKGGPQEIEIDVVVFATGFKATSFVDSVDVSVRGGAELKKVWDGTPQAFYGLCHPTTPNFFILYGPNTNLGAGSIISMIEAQTDFVARMVGETIAAGYDTVRVKQEPFDKFIQRIYAALRKTPYTANCANWYTNALGINTNSWPFTVSRYLFEVRRARKEFLFEKVGKAAVGKARY